MEPLLNDDDTIETPDKRVLHFGGQRFLDQIVSGGHCFICGAAFGTKLFNHEHVIPEWLLRRHSQFSRRITLPNERYTPYNSYYIDCCKDCNETLSDELESKISVVLKDGHDAFAEFAQEDCNVQKVFVWLSLLFLKTHLKDLMLRWHLDNRESPNTIGESYNWKTLHHVHCVARTPYSQTQIDQGVIGTLVLCRAITGETVDDFDYVDNYQAQTVMLRTGDCCIFAVLNDSKIVQQLMGSQLEKVSAPISTIQQRELMTLFSINNIYLKDRPSYFTEFNSNELMIRASIPKTFTREPIPHEHFGLLMMKNCGQLITDKSCLQDLQQGRISFLFDKQGSFTPAVL